MDVAIIGIGLRFPGRANSPEELWQMLSTGESAWSTIPPERFGNGLSSTHETVCFQPGISMEADISEDFPARGWPLFEAGSWCI